MVKVRVHSRGEPAPIQRHRQRAVTSRSIGTSSSARGRRHQPATLAHDERITEQLAKPRERIADRRLRHVQPRGGAWRCAFEHGMKDEEKVEVDRRQVQLMTLHIMNHDWSKRQRRPSLPFKDSITTRRTDLAVPDSP
jgi:hypothetical protein